MTHQPFLLSSIRTALLAVALGLSTSAALAGGQHAGGHHNPAIGEPGVASRVTRTIDVEAADTMRFTPSHLEIRQGETLRLKVHNEGRVMHEFVLGTREELDAHAALMMKFPDMEHDEPYMAHVAPGRTGEIIWNFNRAGNFEFACLIAGHYAAGMVGVIKVSPA